MTQPSKQRVIFIIEQKLDYAKLRVHENYTHKQIIEISGIDPTAIARWNRQYLAELNGQTPKSSKAMTLEQQEIQSLKKYAVRISYTEYSDDAAMSAIGFVVLINC